MRKNELEDLIKQKAEESGLTGITIKKMHPTKSLLEEIDGSTPSWSSVTTEAY